MVLGIRRLILAGVQQKRPFAGKRRRTFLHNGAQSSLQKKKYGVFLQVCLPFLAPGGWEKIHGADTALRQLETVIQWEQMCTKFARTEKGRSLFVHNDTDR